jgi:tetraacyldisaccharide 4'-kinase
MGSNVLVMDDGFQHRRLGRDLDIVLLDATNPFGYGLLPRGMRREPVRSLRRADLVVLTRSDQVKADALRALRGRVGGLAPGIPALSARHRPVEVCDQHGRADPEMAIDAVGGRRAWTFAGLANPMAFVRTVEQLGVRLAGRRFWPDHHTWSDRELDEMARQAAEANVDLVLTTEKDAVKLPPDRPDWPAPLRIVRVGIEFLKDDATTARDLIDHAVAGKGPTHDQAVPAN